MEPKPISETVLKLQQPLVALLNKYYFRLEVKGWERFPDETCLVIGVHSGGALTVDAWTLVQAWLDHVDGQRPLHGIARPGRDGPARGQADPARLRLTRPPPSTSGRSPGRLTEWRDVTSTRSRNSARA